MKRTDKSSAETKNFELFMSKLSGNEILSTQALIAVRGGDGEASGGELIITYPKPPQS
jgi:hypothetical protein